LGGPVFNGDKVIVSISFAGHTSLLNLDDTDLLATIKVRVAQIS